MQRALDVVLKTNQTAGSIINSYILSITNIRRKALAIMASSGTKKNVSESCFAYIR